MLIRTVRTVSTFTVAFRVLEYYHSALKLSCVSDVLAPSVILKMLIKAFDPSPDKVNVIELAPSQQPQLKLGNYNFVNIELISVLPYLIKLDSL